MSLETFGVNIMKRIFNPGFLLTVSFMLIVMAGCSGESQQSASVPDKDTDLAVKTEPVTARDTVEQVLNEAVDRVRYGDKSGLYYNEFDYLRETVNFDEYVKINQVHYARTDTLKFLEVLELIMYDHDSADVVLNIHSEGPSGIASKVQDTIVVYYFNNRWIKPTVSSMKEQLRYDKEKDRSSGKG